MRIKKIIYFKTYPITSSGAWEKIGLEADLDEGDKDVRKALYNLKKTVEDFHYESNKVDEKIDVATALTRMLPEDNLIPEAWKPFVTPPSLTKVAELLRDINSCAELKVLDSYRLIVKGDEDLQAAYDKKREELIQLETQSILKTTDNLTKKYKKSKNEC